MKYLRTYENSQVDVGDYVMFKMNIVDSSSDEIVVRKNRPYMIFKIEDGRPYITCDDDRITSIHMNDKRVKKISKEEALILLDVEKYNL